MKITNSSVFWYSKKEPGLPVILDRDLRVQVAIVGGGMAGLSCAQSLAEAGCEVALLEKDFCGAGASGKTSGFITPDSEIELGSLVQNYGPEKAKRIWEFVLSGVEIIRRNVESHDIDCDYQIQDSLFIANDNAGVHHVEKEHSARTKLHYQSKLYDQGAISRVIGSEHYRGGVRYPDTFGINSYLYCQALRDILVKKGVKIYENTPAVRLKNNSVETLSAVVEADHIIVCADRFIPDLGALKKEIYHVQTFLGISRPLTDAQVKQVFPEAPMMVWDTKLIYNYFRLAGENRILLGGGDVLYTYAHTESSNTARFRRRLTDYFCNKFTGVPLDLEYVWPGMLGVSKDLLPVMGADKYNKKIWYAGAATGLPWAAALGNYAAERILTGRNELDEVFSWQRKFVIGPRMQTLLSTPVTYALSHGMVKYF